jgi:hypothetical protein
MSAALLAQYNDFCVELDEDGIAHLVLGQPGAMPTTDRDGHAAIGKIWRTLAEHPGVRCILVRSIGKGFCAIHLTLPPSWQQRRFRVPEGLVLHFADLPPQERSWINAVPVTSTPRTLNDCALAGLSPDLLRQAAKQALARGLVTKAELGEVENVLEPFGGIKG